MDAISIDIGTGSVKTAYVEPTGKASMITNQRGDSCTPSVLYYNKDGTVYVGTEAIEQGFLDPKSAVWHPKLKLGTTDNLINNGLQVTAEDAVYELGKAAIADAERVLGKKVEKVVATCPADFNDAQKQALKNALERTGVEVILIMHEPTAAGYGYAEKLQGGRHKVGIFDFGAGTFDFSVLDVNGSVAQVIATEGIKKLGGNDVNNALLGLILDRVEKECGVRPSPDKHPLVFYDLRLRVEHAKYSLNTQAKVPVVVAFEGHHVVVEITQKELHEILKAMMQQALDCVDRGMKAANTTYKDLFRFVMVGGASRPKFVQDCVAEHTGLIPRVDIDPDKAVPYGAALRCVAELHSRGEKPDHNGIVIPSPAIISKDVTGHGVGCSVIDTSSSTHRMVNAVIIRKNTPIPCKRVEYFYLQHEDQQEACIEILQGDDSADRDDCLLIGELALDNLPPESVRTKRIQIEYFIDANGMVTATATDKVSGKQATVSVDYKKGIKPKPKPNAA